MKQNVFHILFSNAAEFGAAKQDPNSEKLDGSPNK